MTEYKVKKELYMEDVSAIALDAFDLIESRLKEFGIDLTADKLDDKIYIPIQNALEQLSNGEYRSMN